MSKNIKNIRKISNIPKNCRERYLPTFGKASEQLVANGLIFSGISNLRKNYQIGYPELSSRHMIILTKSGEGYLHTSKESYKLTPGTLLSVPAGNACMFGVSDEHWDIFWFYLQDIPFWAPLKKEHIDFRATNMIPKLEVAMEGYLAEMQADSDDKKAAELFAQLIVYYLDKTLDLIHDKEIDEKKNKLDTLWQLVQDSPGKDWSKVQMAERLHVSTSTFDRMVKKYYGTTPWQKVIEIRLDQAKMLLLKTDYPLQVIAERLGYANEFIFSSAFKTYAGQSPKFYRQEKALKSTTSKGL